MTLLREALRELPDATFVDLYEGEEAYLVVLDVPGTSPEDVDVEASRTSLTVTAERDASAPEGYEPVHSERGVDVDVTLPLPPDARGGDVETTAHERGVLELTIPRETGTEPTG